MTALGLLGSVSFMSVSRSKPLGTPAIGYNLRLFTLWSLPRSCSWSMQIDFRRCGPWPRFSILPSSSVCWDNLQFTCWQWWLLWEKPRSIWIPTSKLNWMAPSNPACSTQWSFWLAVSSRSLFLSSIYKAVPSWPASLKIDLFCGLWWWRLCLFSCLPASQSLPWTYVTESKIIDYMDDFPHTDFNRFYLPCFFRDTSN